MHSEFHLRPSAQEIFTKLEKKPTGQHCSGMEGVVEEGKEALEKDEEGASFDSWIIGGRHRHGGSTWNAGSRRNSYFDLGKGRIWLADIIERWWKESVRQGTCPQITETPQTLISIGF